MAELGKLIGIKFHETGEPKLYPGNTVIADIDEKNPAHAVVLEVCRRLKQQKLDKFFILLPSDSYHITVIRGVNDRVRTPDFWPPALDVSAAMEEADRFIARCVAAVPNPGRLHMKFAGLAIDDSDFRIVVAPAFAEEEQKIRSYRDAVAQSIGLRLPGHDEYRFHITVAYTQYVPKGAEQEKLQEFCHGVNRYLAGCPAFYTTPPYMAFYNDMCFFSSRYLPRTTHDNIGR
ncbi:MAG: DUF1868 domain-containing protein [Oscillospiraceae bacterium]